MQSCKRCRPAALAVTALLALPALPARSGNESRSAAYPLADGLIEVVADFSENSIYWCGAATYAMGALDRPGTDRLYVWQGPAPSSARAGEKSVRFALRPPPDAGPVTSLTNDVTMIGNSLSVAQARQTCNERTTIG